MNLLLILLTMPLPWVYGLWEGITDAKKIASNGKLDSLKEKWHAENAIRRGLILGFGSLAVWAVLFWLFELSIWFYPAYLLYAIAAFGFKFTTKLNTLRDKEKWYVSMDRRASKTDKFFRWCADTWNWYLGKFSRKFGLKNGYKFIVTASGFSAAIHTVFMLLSILILIAFLVHKMLITN